MEGKWSYAGRMIPSPRRLGPVVAVLIVLSSACGGYPFAPFTPGDFSLTDVNPDSPTYQQTRALSETHGKVVIVYFVSYG
jgi:hypothetical protein